MPTTVEVILAPAQLGPLSQRDLRQVTCVVFDILRATSTMVTALAHGATAIVPVSEMAEALALRQRQPGVLLAGERGGLRPRPEQTGGVEFDLGNSPREFTPEKVAGRTVIMTTTNGTRAVRACAGAGRVLVGSFLNLAATVRYLARRPPAHLPLVCAGTGDGPALEDLVAAGALCAALEAEGLQLSGDDSVVMARQLYECFGADLVGMARLTRNGRRLLDLPELREDVAWCLQRDRFELVAGLGADGRVRRLS
jgi:2-phosphosulfolactate phosphatase